MAITLLSAGTDETFDLTGWASPSNASSDTAQAHMGSRALKITNWGQARRELVAGNTGRLSYWLYVSQAEGSDGSPILTAISSGTNTVFQLWLNDSGALEFAPGNAVSSANLGYAGWHHLVLAWNLASTTDNVIRAWLDGTLVLDLTDVTLDRIFAADGGIIWRSATYDLWIDDVYLDDDGSCTFPGAIGVTAKRPTAVVTDDWDTTVGGGAVDERPLDATHYRAHAGAGQVDLTYAIEAAADGDVDLSGKTIVGYGGWAWAKGTAGGSGTPALVLNGALVPITLTAAPAYYAGYVTDGEYPANVNGVIGLESSGTDDDTFLYECGVLVAFTDAPPPRPTRFTIEVGNPRL